MWFTSRSVCWAILGIVLIYGRVCIGSWAPFTSRYKGHSAIGHAERKRFGESVIEEGLPLWLERRAVFTEPEPEWIPEVAVPRINEQYGIEDIRKFFQSITSSFPI